MDDWLTQEEVAAAELLGGDSGLWEDTHNWCRGISANGKYDAALPFGLAETISDIAIPWEEI